MTNRQRQVAVFVVAFVLALSAPVLSRAATFVVDDPGDDSLSCVPGGCSLREAIDAANATPGPDTITFALGAGVPVVTITLGPLPTITDPVVIDGNTGGATRVWIRPQAKGAILAPGLRVTAGGSTFKDLVITGFLHGIEATTGGGNLVVGSYLGVAASGATIEDNFASGVKIDGSPSNVIGGATAALRNVISGNTYGVMITGGASANNQVLGNYIGTDATGTTDLGNTQTGVMIMNGAHDNIVGGTVAGAGNVISGNDFFGVDLNGDAAARNVVQGNLIGTDAAGNAALGNGRLGVAIDSPDNQVGGSSAGARNVISANGWYGVWIDGPAARRNVIRGNLIGTAADGSTPLGNGSGGIEIRNEAALTKVGGTAAGAGNTIASNGGAGVDIVGGTGNAVRRNSIRSNAGLGIDLLSDGVTPNDAKDPDLGPNLLQNYPRLTSAAYSNGTVHVHGVLNSVPTSAYTVELFASVECDPSGFGEGIIYLGSVDLITGALGKAVVDTVVPLPLLAGGQLTATATSAQSNSTSEFSRCIPIVF